MQEPSPAEARELVGWALQSRRDESEQSEAVARRVLATALGIDEPSLDNLDLVTLRAALRRLRSLVAFCDHLASEATIDDLTGALRRGPGLAALGRELDRARRTGEGGIAVAFIDVDGLKALNDSEGHAAGDELLRNVVAAIRERVRSYDLVLRYGGDEFVCALIGVTRDQAEHTISDIREKLAQRSGGRTLSVGLVEAEEGDSAAAVVARADAALYRERQASGV